LFNKNSIFDKKFRSAKFSPKMWTADDQPRRKVIYVDQTNNLFYKNYAESGEIISVTSDADENNGILNGIPDWVYEEEMLSSRAATWWSPNGQFIAYLKSYTKDIENIRFNYYGRSPDYRGRADDVTIQDPARVSGPTFNYVELGLVSAAKFGNTKKI